VMNSCRLLREEDSELNVTVLGIWVLRILFGLLCIPAGFGILLGLFIFDDPSATENRLAWMLASSPIVYLCLFALSLAPVGLAPSAAVRDRRRLLRALLPLIGIAWLALAILLLKFQCNGEFGCS